MASSTMALAAFENLGHGGCDFEGAKRNAAYTLDRPLRWIDAHRIVADDQDDVRTSR